MAQLLLTQAQTRRWELGITRDDVLQRMAQGLEGSANFTPEEVRWVLTRLTEQLD